MARKRNRLILFLKVIFITLILFCIGFGFFVLWKNQNSLPSSSLINISVDVICMCIGLPLYINQVFSQHKNKSKTFFEYIILIDLLNLFLDLIAWWVDGKSNLRILNIVDNTVFYILGYVILFIFYMYLNEELIVYSKSERIMHYILGVGFIIMTILAITNPWTELFFYVDKSGYYHRGDFYYINLIYFGMIHLVLIYIIILNRPDIKRLLSYLSYIVLPFTVTIIQSYNYGYSFMYAAIFVSIIILYLNVQLETDKLLRKRQFEIEDQRAINILSQVQPHFIYNVLNSIYYLTDNDASKAKEAIDKFSRYLRSSLDIKQNTGLIKLSEELEHVKLYISLEEIRFEGLFETNYSIENPDILVPRLSIQPLVENAIKHGLSLRDSKGKLSIKEYSDINNYYIEIENNGKGFDTSKPLSRERTHLGVENVRYRLSRYLGATLQIDSDIELGTVCTITIPKEVKKDEHISS